MSDASKPDPLRLQAARSVKVIAFDVFGTVVNWFNSISREVAAMNLGVDADEFASAWREGYAPSMRRVMSGELGWTRIDDLHRMILDDLLVRYKITHLTEEQKRHLNKAWHRLDGWPDSARGLARLRTRYTVCTLSNGNIALLTAMAKHAGLPWDCILSAEVFHKYKPDPGTYLGVADVFGLPPAEVMLAAAHHEDLAAARNCGLQTAYIERPFEYSRTQAKNISPRPDNTLHTTSIEDLATQMGC